MQGVQDASPILKVSNQSRKAGPIRRNDVDFDHREPMAAEQQYAQVTGLGQKKRLEPPREPLIHSHHGPELPHGPRRAPEASWAEPERGIRPKPVPIRDDLSQPHGPHRKADPDFYREAVDPHAVAGPRREERKPVEVLSNSAQTLMFVPKGPHRRSDRHWEQVPEDPSRPGPAAAAGGSMPERKAPGRVPEQSDPRNYFAGTQPGYVHMQAQAESHRFYKQNEEGNWEKNQKSPVPEPVLKIRRANESSLDMPLSKPAERYVQKHSSRANARNTEQYPQTDRFSSRDSRGSPNSPSGAPAPGHHEERILDPAIHHSLHQKGYRKFRDRGWFQDDTLSATISPRVRVGTANKPAGFGLPNYDHLGKNDPVTRPTAKEAREALQYPEQRKHNDESKNQPLADPRTQQF